MHKELDCPVIWSGGMGLWESHWGGDSEHKTSSLTRLNCDEFSQVKFAKRFLDHQADGCCDGLLQ
jgi:hypothetical protein